MIVTGLDPAVAQRQIQDAYTLWAQTADHAKEDRCLEMSDKLHDWSNKLFMGETNADALFTMVAFVSEWCMAAARETDTDPQMLVCTVQLGLQQGLEQYIESQANDDD